MNNINPKITYPRNDSDFNNLTEVIDNWVIDKSIKPFFNKSHRFFTQGSCFAKNIAKYLNENEINVHYNVLEEFLNSPLANSHYFQFLKKNPKEEINTAIKNSDIFILTIGVAPCWFLKETGNFVFSPDPKKINEFFCKTISVQEATESLIDVYQSIKEINENIKIVITLSPVALNKSFEFNSPIFADCLSKSILRVAIHDSINDSKLINKPIYFPSFEIVRWIGAHRGDAYGNTSGKAEGHPPRDVSPHYVDAIIKSFIKHYQI